MQVGDAEWLALVNEWVEFNKNRCIFSLISFLSASPSSSSSSLNSRVNGDVSVSPHPREVVCC
jgi:hypothetical protein